MGAAYCCLPRTVALWVDHTIKPHTSVPQKSQPYTTRTFSVAAKPTKPGAVVGICQPPPPSSQLGEGQLVKESDPTTAGMGNAGKAMTHSCSLSANPIPSHQKAGSTTLCREGWWGGCLLFICSYANSKNLLKRARKLVAQIWQQPKLVAESWWLVRMLSAPHCLDL